MAEKLSRLIRPRREELGITQVDLAKAINVSQTYIARLEDANDDRTPSREVCRGLARVLELSEDEVFRAAGHFPQGEPMQLSDDEIELVTLYRRSLPLQRQLALAALRVEAEPQEGTSHGLPRVAESREEYQA